MLDVSAIVLFGERPDRTTAFYRTLGIELHAEDHGDGMVHAATDLGNVHIAVFPASDAGTAPGWLAGGSTFVGFNVDSLDETPAALRRTGAKVLVDHQVREWGCRAIVEDPDGRAIEISQRRHCPDAEDT